MSLIGPWTVWVCDRCGKIAAGYYCNGRDGQQHTRNPVEVVPATQLQGAVTALEAISAQDERGPATLREARMMARQALASLRGQ